MINVRDTWCTPRWLFDHLHNVHDFTIDAAASSANHLLPRYWTMEDDALQQDWGGERVFCNPPFGRGNDIESWIRKGLDAELASFILPARTDTAWFDFALRTATLIQFILGRVDFVPPPGIESSGNFERTMIVTYSDCFAIRHVKCTAREDLGYVPTKRKGRANA